MKIRYAAAAFLLGMLLAPPGAAQDDGGGLTDWALKFSHQPLDTITVHYKDGRTRSFYYFTFTIENTGKAPALLFLHVKARVGADPRKQAVHVARPSRDAEETVRRISRTPDLKNINEINRHNAEQGKPGFLKPGESLQGIAVLGTFDREWDVANVTVSGLEPHATHARVRKVGKGFTMAHRAYHLHNQRILDEAGKDAESKYVHAIVRHEVVWKMKFHREGDEFEPELDPIILDWEGWDVVSDPAPKIVQELESPFPK